MHNILHVALKCIKGNLSPKILRSNFRLCHSLGTQKCGKHSTFVEVINNRRKEARKSIVVQVSSEKSFPELYNYCSQFGEIVLAHHYKIPHEEYHYILIEFTSEDVAKEALNSSCYNEDLTGLPVKSSFLWFKAGNKRSAKAALNIPENVLKSTDGIRNPLDSEIHDLLFNAGNLEDQILILHRITYLNDLGTRLRFLAALQVENSITGMFPFANAQPFGSSVNGFGKMGCDLDLILRFDAECKRDMYQSRLVFHTKENLTNGRSQVQRQMESIGDMLHLFLPGVCHVRRILQARIPIIKYHHDHLNLEVDLSMSNLSGLYMSELLYMFGEIDNRVRPLVFTLRRWAQTVGLTNPSPGRWITNFSLTCLAIFFLQQMKKPILPPIKLLCKSATKEDIRITEDGVNCTFIRDLNNLQFETKNNSKLNELLLQFFEFYSQFDFNNRAVSLNEGQSILKPDHSAMFIVNPLEQVLNVSKNVSLEECERFKIEVRNAAWILESKMEINNSTTIMKRDEPWGLLNLFKSPDRAIIRPNLFFKPRMVEVSELFDDKHETKEENVEYKNKSVRNQVQNIKAKAKVDIKQLKINAMSAEGNKHQRR